MADLKSELSGDLARLILGLMMPPAHYDAKQLKKAMEVRCRPQMQVLGGCSLFPSSAHPCPAAASLSTSLSPRGDRMACVHPTGSGYGGEALPPSISAKESLGFYCGWFKWGPVPRNQRGQGDLSELLEEAGGTWKERQPPESAF